MTEKTDPVPSWELVQQAGLDETLLDALLKLMPSGALVANAEGRILFVNRQMEEVWRMSMQPGMAVPVWRGFHPDGTEVEAEDWPLARALNRGEIVRDEEIEIVLGDGGRSVVRVSAAPLSKEGGEVVAALMTCLDISETRRRYTSRKFLSDAGALLSSSLDPVTTLRNIARLAVPTLADWCTIDLVDSEGNIERVAVEHIDQRKVQVAAELARRHSPMAGSGAGVAEAIRAGRSELVHEVTPGVLDSFAEGPRHRELPEEPGLRSVLIVPLLTRSGPPGDTTCVPPSSAWP